MSGGAANSWQPILQQLLPYTTCPISDAPPRVPSSRHSQPYNSTSQLAAALQAAAAQTHSTLAAVQSLHAVGTEAIQHTARDDQLSLIVPLTTPAGHSLGGKNGPAERAAETLQQWVDVGALPKWAGEVGARMAAWMVHDERGVMGMQQQRLAAAMHMPCYGGQCPD